MQLQGVKFKVLKRVKIYLVCQCQTANALQQWNNEIESEKWVYFTQLFE